MVVAESRTELAHGLVSSVTGPVEPEGLGLVLPHEHLLSSFVPAHDTAEAWAVAAVPRPAAAGDRHRYESPLTIESLGHVTVGGPNRDNWRLDDEATAITEVLDLGAQGGRTLVDATSVGLGRDPGGLRRIAVSTGLNIVMGSGWYHPAWTEGLAERSSDDLADEIVRDLTIGVDGVRAGIIGELAALDPREPAERRLLTAAARASARTGASIVLARSAERAMQHSVIELLVAEGARPSRIAIAHCDGLAPDLDGLLGLLDLGVYVQFDRLARIVTVYTEADDQEVAAAIVSLARLGHAEHLLVSSGIEEKQHLRAFGGDGYGYLPRQFFWLLEHAGGAELIPTLTEENPRRWLTLATEVLR